MNSPDRKKPKHRLLKAFVWTGVTAQALLTVRGYRRAARLAATSHHEESAGEELPQAPARKIKPLKTFLGAFVGLQVLLACTVGSAFINFGGAANTAINLTISVLMMLLLMTLFMHESAARRLTQLISATGILWVILMIGLTIADYLTRVHIPAPWH